MRLFIFVCFAFFCFSSQTKAQVNSAIRIKGVYSSMASLAFKFKVNLTGGNAQGINACWKPNASFSTLNNLAVVDELVFFGSFGSSNSSTASLEVTAWNDVAGNCVPTSPTVKITSSFSNGSSAIGTPQTYEIADPNLFKLRFEVVAIGSTDTFLAQFPQANHRLCLNSPTQLQAVAPYGFNIPTTAKYEWEYTFYPDSIPAPELQECIEQCLGFEPYALDSIQKGTSEWCGQLCKSLYPDKVFWQALQVSGTSNISTTSTINFTPTSQNIVSSSGLVFDQNRPVYFRVRLVAGGGWSNPLFSEIMPPPPSFSVNVADLIVYPSCPNSPSGYIQVNNIVKAVGVVGNVSYMLRQGYDNNAPTTIFSPTASVATGTTSTNKFAITGVPVGKYTLIILNQGGIYGVCQNTKNIEVLPHQPLVGTPVITNVTCFGGSNGSINYNVAGGNPNSSLTHSIQAINPVNLPTGTKTVSGRNAIFSGLKAGKYRITVSDACGQTTQTEVIMLEAPRFFAKDGKVLATLCNNPINGVFVLKDSTETGEYLIPKSNSMIYTLYKTGVSAPMRSNVSDTLTSSSLFYIKNLGVGSYTLHIRNAIIPQTCSEPTSFAIFNFLITPATELPLPNVSLTPVSCNGDGTGTIDVLGANVELYAYHIFDISRNRYWGGSNTSFTGLKEGNYHVICKRASTGCQDSTFVTKYISQPTPLVYQSVDKQNVGCAGASTGVWKLNISGGTPPYQIDFLKYENTKDSDGNTIGWDIKNVTTSDSGVITWNGLATGAYKIKITDVAGCWKLTDSTTIFEPLRLHLLNPVVSLGVCYGERTTVSLGADGGVAPHTFYMREEKGFYVPASTKQTINTDGKYFFKVVDANGCEAQIDYGFVITLPKKALQVKANAILNAQGFNASCPNANDGVIRLEISGDGDVYEYKIGNELEYQPLKLDRNADGLYPIKKLGSGIYDIFVRDMRGCVVTIKGVELTSPETAVLSLKTATKATCSESKDGSLSITSSGAGIASVRVVFLQENNTLNPNGGGWITNIFEKTVYEANSPTAVFSLGGLNAGNYKVYAQTVFGCSVEPLEIELGALQEYDFSFAKMDALCSETATGMIELRQGVKNNLVEDYTVHLINDFGETVVTLDNFTYKFQNLVGGDYKLVVKGVTSCVVERNITISEPEPVTFEAQSVNACPSGIGGKINFTAQGGTPPYLYSIDNGITYQAQPNFEVNAGSYNVLVKDMNGCPRDGKIVVGQTESSGPAPTLKFLVSTINQSQDSLAIKDVSLPKPDSIRWAMPETAQIIDSNQWEPIIRFSPTGSFNITMRAYYGGCVYVLSKPIEIKPFDPNSNNSLPTGVRMLQNLSVYPNPNNGNFTYGIKVLKKRKVLVTLTSAMGQLQYSKEWNGVTDISQEVNLPDLNNGIYILRVITDVDARQINVSVVK